jgi:tetratricopeptide (TPR) repeat protein
MSADLQTALAHHQAGRLDEAVRVYQALLARDPDHADALHLLGVAAHQQGDPARAAELIGRAVALRPDVAAFHCNLAEARRALGEPERAAACCRTALHLQPDYPEAANNLGLALHALGRAAEAVEQFRRALRLRPGFALAHNNLGNALRDQGDLSGAADHFRQALALDPALAEAHSNLGQTLLEGGRAEEAVSHCREAVRLRPRLAEAHNNLGNALRELGRLAEARLCYAEALRLDPGLAMVHNNMGQAVQEQGDPGGAIAWYQQALARDATAARFHANLAGALAEQERYDEAAAHCRTALTLDANHAEAHAGMAGLFREQGEHDQALAHYREAVRLKPDLAAAHSDLGSLYEELGRLDEARAAWREALRLRPAHAPALADLATHLRADLPDEEVHALRGLIARPEMAPARRAALHFALAHVLDARGEPREAGDHLRRANALRKDDAERRGLGYDPAAHERFVDGLIAAFTPDFFARVRGLGADSTRPVFVVGLPRSATTLTEQILASHPLVFGAGELRLARETFEALPAERLASADGNALRRLAGQYLDGVARREPSRPRVVDKMPDNYLYLGWAQALFPRAAFVHCRRDLRDVAVSCWMTNFRHIRWANDPGHIAHRFGQYARLIDHWRRVLPVPLLEIDYEETVADLEGVARRLVAWCGLDWDPACLRFHETSRPVRTASVTQVRRPISARSVGRWKNYEEDLAELFARLPGA